jgi:hypothetical protein
MECRVYWLGVEFKYRECSTCCSAHDRRDAFNLEVVLVITVEQTVTCLFLKWVWILLQIKCLLSKPSLRSLKHKHEFPNSPVSCHDCADIWILFECGPRLSVSIPLPDSYSRPSSHLYNACDSIYYFEYILTFRSISNSCLTHVQIVLHSCIILRVEMKVAWNCVILAIQRTSVLVVAGCSVSNLTGFSSTPRFNVY